MSHYTLGVIAQLQPEIQNRFVELCKSQQDYVIDFFAKKLEKPLSKFDINNTNSEFGKFDYYSVVQVLPINEMLVSFEEWDRTPLAILLPNLEWIESEKWFYFVNENNQKDYNDWVKDIKKILDQYPNSLVALIDCHI